MIFSDWNSTGDGLVTAQQVLGIMVTTGSTLSELAGVMEKFPQILVNVKVKEKRPLESLPQVIQTIRETESTLGTSGRVLVRYSGTEKICRVMVECEDHERCPNTQIALQKRSRRKSGSKSLCGIFGYIGGQDAVKVAIDGLKRLEYRGYDSAVLRNQRRCDLSIKEVGKVAVLEKEVESAHLSLDVAISHTRWATHGSPTILNAHPHTICTTHLHWSITESSKLFGITR